MTKSVLAGLVGVLIKEGRLTFDQSAGWPVIGGGGREHIRIADLLAMSSGLRFNEEYGAVSDVTRMLYLQPDMAGFARGQPLAHPAGEFWSYSSGTANILSRIAQDAAGPLAATYPAQKLFIPLGMTTATMETDEHGARGFLLHVCERPRLGKVRAVTAARRSMARPRIAAPWLCRHDGVARRGIRRRVRARLGMALGFRRRHCG